MGGFFQKIISLCAVALSGAALVLADCDDSDANLVALQQIYCASMGESPNCPVGNYTSSMAAHDWPTQSVYMKNILAAVVDPATCLETQVAKDLVVWLDVVGTDSDESMWWWNWYIFQPQYYDMPRVPGARIESPATLGRKCWAFAFNRQLWADGMRAALTATMATWGLDLGAFVAQWDDAIPMSMQLCDQVMANCFVNASYDPELRNGTCPALIDEFYVGFSWENGNNNAIDNGQCGVGDCWRNDSVKYPFNRYTQTDHWRADADFAVNTALNWIV